MKWIVRLLQDMKDTKNFRTWKRLSDFIGVTEREVRAWSKEETQPNQENLDKIRAAAMHLSLNPKHYERPSISLWDPE
jgi:hypothetical protein